MLKRDLICVDIFTSNLKGTEYEISVFLDEITLNTYYGSNLKNIEVGKKYKCELTYNSKKKNNRLQVTNIII